MSTALATVFPTVRVHSAASRVALPVPRTGAMLRGCQPRGAASMSTTDRGQSTATLLSRIREGDVAAREQICSTCLPLLMRWAHGRLPRRARDLVETSDIVQSTLLRALSNLDGFESRHPGAFMAYLRTVLLNVVRNEIRRSTRRGESVDLDMAMAAQDSALSQAVGQDLLWDYERALAELSPESREAVILRLEFGLDWEEIAEAMQRPSANAARMLVARALADLGARLGAS